MWYFSHNELYRKYRKLIKKIMSIDPNIKITEDTDDSVRLHLPNYKGNQTMDFHIYLLEPFLFISFVTVINGETITVTNHFNQSLSQEEIFNIAMANNLNRVKDVLKCIYNGEDESSNYTNSITKRRSEELWTSKTLVKLNKHQRYTLFFFVSFFSGLFPLFSSDKKRREETKKMASYYQRILNLSEEEAYRISRNSGLSINDFYLRLKSVDSNSELNRFLYLCVSIIDLSYDKNAIEMFSNILGIIGYSIEDLYSLIKKVEYIPMKHFFDNRQLNCMPPIISSKAENTWDKHSLSYLKEEQRIVLFYFLNYFSRFIPSNQRNKRKEAITLLRRYQDILEISDEKVISVPKKSEFIKKEYYEELANIHNYQEFNRFIYFCVQLIDLIDVSNYTNAIIVFNNILRIINYTIDDVRILHKRIGMSIYKHFYDEINELEIDNSSYIITVRNTLGEYRYISLVSETIEAQKKIKKKKTPNTRKTEAIIQEAYDTDVSDEHLLNVWTDDYGVKYSSDKKRLLEVPKNLIVYSIRKGTKVICDNAFNECELIKQIVIPETVSSIGNSAFFGCKDLSVIIIPESVNMIGSQVFTECCSLMSIIVEENNTYFDSRNNCNAIIDTRSNTLIEGCSSSLIPNSVVKIGDGAFAGRSLTSISIPDSVVEIGNNSFEACEGLTSVIIPNSVKKIGNLAFRGCTNLVTIKIPNSVKLIGDGISNNSADSVFWGCKNLNYIYIDRGSKSKFEEILPGYTDKLVEQSCGASDSNNKISKITKEGAEFVDDFDLDSSLKKHVIMLLLLRPETEFRYYLSKNKSMPIWIYSKEGIYMPNNDCALGIAPYMWIIEKSKVKNDICRLLDFLNRQNSELWIESYTNPTVLIDDIKKYFPSFKLANDPQKVKVAIQWAWIDMQSILRLIDYCMNNLNRLAPPAPNYKIAHSVRECTSMDNVARLILSEMNISYNSNSCESDDELPF